MSTELVQKMVDALRDTAAKIEETVTVKRADIDLVMNRRFGQEDVYRDEERDRYSREWVAGRLLGMADVAEAMLLGAQKDRP